MGPQLCKAAGATNESRGLLPHPCKGQGKGGLQARIESAAAPAAAAAADRLAGRLLAGSHAGSGPQPRSRLRLRRPSIARR